MDITMPVMTGFEALQQLKADTSTAYIPVVLLTADDSAGSMAIGYEAGSNLYLTKPFSSQRAGKQVRSVLRDCGKRSSVDRSSVIEAHVTSMVFMPVSATGGLKMPVSLRDAGRRAATGKRILKVAPLPTPALEPEWC
jgi:CheY-like chemotaxis protein